MSMALVSIIYNLIFLNQNMKYQNYQTDSTRIFTKQKWKLIDDWNVSNAIIKNVKIPYHLSHFTRDISEEMYSLKKKCDNTAAHIVHSTYSIVIIKTKQKKTYWGTWEEDLPTMERTHFNVIVSTRCFFSWWCHQ